MAEESYIVFPKNYLDKHPKIEFVMQPDAVYRVKQAKNRLYFELNPEVTEFEFKLTHPLTEQQYNRLQYINKSHLKIETLNYDTFYTSMGTFAIISAFTALIISGLVVWANNNKTGRVYTEDGEYKLKDKSGKIIRRRPDVSYISFKQISEEEQNSWQKKFIEVPPTLAIEIVSSEVSLQKELNKMRDIWMANGTQLGIVIFPHKQKYFVFENQNYTEYLLTQVFTYPLLPGYEGNFNHFSETK